MTASSFGDRYFCCQVQDDPVFYGTVVNVCQGQKHTQISHQICFYKESQTSKSSKFSSTRKPALPRTDQLANNCRWHAGGIYCRTIPTAKYAEISRCLDCRPIVTAVLMPGVHKSG